MRTRNILARSILTCVPMLMLAADNGGGGGSAKVPTVPELTQRLKDLETEKQTLATQLAAEQEKATKLEGEKQTLEKQSAALQQEKEALQKTNSELLVKASDANTAKVKAEEDLKTADTRAEARLREIDAKNGGTLPPKEQQAGDFTGGGKNGKEMTRAAFNALPAIEQREFCLKNGKLTD